MFAEPLVKWSTHGRTTSHLWLGEVLAAAGLILLIFGLDRIGRLPLAPAAVASYIGAAYWFTSSTPFANPAVIIGGLSLIPSPALPRVRVAVHRRSTGQVALGLDAVVTVYGRPAFAADEVVVRHGEPELASPDPLRSPRRRLS